MNETLDKQTPLEDLMVAMDVVDTLRHQKSLVERELDGEGRRERLLKRLKELYQAQGIDVSDQVLQEGIDALEQERFQYQAVDSSWQTKLAAIWVSRARWGKPIGFLVILATVFYGYYYVSDVLPRQQAVNRLPKQVEQSLTRITNTAKNVPVVEQAQQQALTAKQAIADQRFERAESIIAEMESTADLLGLDYTIRIVSKPNQPSAVWRVPSSNANTRNYYLIVEAIDNNNKVIELDVLNQENNKRKRVTKWGLRVSEQTFRSVEKDKKDDGIIQSNQVGQKEIGFLEPTFSIPTSGAAITEW